MNRFPMIVFHNQECGTSRAVMEIIHAAGLYPITVPYLREAWTRSLLLTLFAAANLSPRQALREKNSPAEELGLLASDVSDEAILAAMLEHPILVNRPFVVTPKGVRLCRPSETVRELLP